MEWLAVITMICSGQAPCETKLKECVEWVYVQPESQAKDLSKLDISVWLQDAKIQAKVCR